MKEEQKQKLQFRLEKFSEDPPAAAAGTLESFCLEKSFNTIYVIWNFAHTMIYGSFFLPKNEEETLYL